VRRRKLTMDARVIEVDAWYFGAVLWNLNHISISTAGAASLEQLLAIHGCLVVCDER